MLAFVEGTTPLKALLTRPTLIPPEAVAAADETYSRFITNKGGNLERAGLLSLYCSPHAVSICSAPVAQLLLYSIKRAILEGNHNGICCMETHAGWAMLCSTA